jgi:hypothetical protein
MYLSIILSIVSQSGNPDSFIRHVVAAVEFVAQQGKKRACTPILAVTSNKFHFSNIFALSSSH